MSLIQEALRRQKEDRASQGQPPAAAAPAATAAPNGTAAGEAPPPLPAQEPAAATPPPEEAEPVKAGRRDTVIIAVGVGAVILALVGAALLFVGLKNWRRGSSAAAGPAAASAPAAVARPPAPAPSAVSVAAPSPPVSAAPPPAAASYAPAAGAETAEGLPPAPRTVWPKLALTALVGSGANGTAVINGKVLSIGETIDGAELTAIGEGGVELEFGGDRQFLRIGGALP